MEVSYTCLLGLTVQMVTSSTFFSLMCYDYKIKFGHLNFK